jgi:hypothetical protein
MFTRTTAGFLLACVAASLSFGCAGTYAPASEYSYFSVPRDGDAWSPKIGQWQTRVQAVSPWAPDGAPEAVLALVEPTIIPLAMPEVAAVTALALPTEAVGVGLPRPALAALETAESRSGPALEPDLLKGTDLRGKYVRFRAEQRRQMVRDFAGWIQTQSRSHYVSDGSVDQWATLEETLRKDGEDCDGLELLVYHGLRDLGFRETEVFRSVIYRSSDLQHHMVTLWFEDPEDPWVIDPTGVTTEVMARMSELSGWVPLKIFTETQEYSVLRKPQPSLIPRLLASNR